MRRMPQFMQRPHPGHADVSNGTGTRQSGHSISVVFIEGRCGLYVSSWNESISSLLSKVAWAAFLGPATFLRWNDRRLFEC